MKINQEKEEQKLKEVIIIDSKKQKHTIEDLEGTQPDQEYYSWLSAFSQSPQTPQSPIITSNKKQRKGANNYL